MLLLAILPFGIAACGSSNTPTVSAGTTAAVTTAASASAVPTVTAATTQPSVSGQAPTTASPTSGVTGAAATTATVTAATTAPSASTAGNASGLSGPIIPADLVLTIDGQPFALLSDAALLLKKLGDRFEKTQAESCVYDGFDKTFDYGFLQVYTIPKGKQDLVDGIYLVDDRYVTARGVKVGDSAQAVVKAYGKPPTAEDYVYNKSGDPANLAEPNLTFIVEDGKVTAVSYYSGSNAQGAASR